MLWLTSEILALAFCFMPLANMCAIEPFYGLVRWHARQLKLRKELACCLVTVVLSTSDFGDRTLSISMHIL